MCNNIYKVNILPQVKIKTANVQSENPNNNRDYKTLFILTFLFLFSALLFFCKKKLWKQPNPNTQKSLHEFSYRPEKHRNEGVQLKTTFTMENTWKIHPSPITK